MAVAAPSNHPSQGNIISITTEIQISSAKIAQEPKFIKSSASSAIFFRTRVAFSCATSAAKRFVVTVKAFVVFVMTAVCALAVTGKLAHLSFFVVTVRRSIVLIGLLAM